MSVRVIKRRRETGPRQPSRGRLLLLGGAIVLWSVGLVWRLAYLQVERHDHYRELAADQHRRVVELHAPRGTILDARGRELAVSIDAESLYASPRTLAARDVDIAQLAGTLESIIDVERSRLERKLKTDSNFVWLRRKLSPDVAAEVRELDVPGLGFLEESLRTYPNGALAAHVLGFVGTDNNGLAGLENRYDSEIAGEVAHRTVIEDGSRQRSVVPSALGIRPVPGADLLLTIDLKLQHVVERELESAVRETGSKAGSIVMLDPRDSAVLALASYPDFDPNAFGRSSDRQRRNRAVIDAYEPGSTFKMITAAAALENLAVRPDDRFDCEMGAITLGKTRIRDHKPFGVLTFREILAKSSNVGVIKAALRTGDDHLLEQIEGFGFGQRTGIDLPGESAGILRSADRWNHMATAYASFGHGLSVTPIQLANAYAALVGGGVWHQPYVVRALSRDGEVTSVAPRVRRPLNLSPATIQDLVRLLEGVVAEGGTATAAAIEGYAVGGKTGTAEKSSRSGYSETGRVASFVGFAPSRDPRVVCLVMLDEPRVVPSGGLIAAPVFSEVVGEALLYLGVAPVHDSPFHESGRLERIVPMATQQKLALREAAGTRDVVVSTGASR